MQREDTNEINRPKRGLYLFGPCSNTHCTTPCLDMDFLSNQVGIQHRKGFPIINEIMNPKCKELENEMNNSLA